MNHTSCTVVALCALFTYGCETKLFTNKINIECAADSPQKTPRGGKFVDQSTLPSKPLRKKLSGQGTPTANKSLLERNSSESSSRIRFVIPVQSPTDNYCRTDDEEVDAIAQSTDVWCWAASAETVMKYHSDTPNKNQCNIVNTIFREEGNPSGPDSSALCCGNTYHSDCQNNGLPSWAFSEYGFTWLMVRGPLEREKLVAQLCANGPFIFILRYAGGGGHSFIVGDYDYDDKTDELFLWVHDHSWTTTDQNANDQIPSSYQRWAYEDYAAGKWEGKIHEHDVNYVYIYSPTEQ